MAGEPGELSAPAWWHGDRPEDGRMMVLAFEYQDNISEPARAAVLSGLGSGETWSELHRFGGAADSSWREARIPCPADMLWLSLPDSTARFRLSSPGGNLYLRNFHLTDTVPGDEQRYNSETRDWLARMQRGHEPAAPWRAQAERPVLTGRWRDSALVPYHRSWLDLVHLNSAPRAGETDLPLRVRIARNESEPLQVGIYANGKDLENVRVTAGKLDGPGGGQALSVEVRVADYSLIDSRIDGFEVEPFPAHLWPGYPFDVKNGESRMVRLYIRPAPGGAVPGVYKAEVRITCAGQENIALPLEVEVLPVELAGMDECGLLLGGHIRRLVPEHDLAFQYRYSHNLACIYVLPELTPSGGGSFDMDFRVLDDFIMRAKRQGFGCIYLFLGGNPFGFPTTMSLERQLATEVLGMNVDEFKSLALENPDSVHPRIAPLYREWASRLGEHARRSDWPRVVLTPFDEPNKWSATSDELGPLTFIRPHFIHSADLLREGWPGVEVAADMYTYDKAIVFLPHLEVYSTNQAHLNDDLPRQVRDAGKKFWEYSTADLTPAFNLYTLAYLFGSHGSSGAHFWAYNWGERFNLLGDPRWQYAWYTPFGMVPTPGMDGLSEGMDIRRLIETLRMKADCSGEEEPEVIGQVFAEAGKMREQVRRFVIETWPHVQPSEPITLERIREYGKLGASMQQWREDLLDELSARR